MTQMSQGRSKSSVPLLLAGITSLSFILICLLYPTESLDSSLRGITIWWDVLFPALFPFFVISEILLGFGIVHFIGTLFDPMMRPVFRVPGIGGFVMAMGFASGYPIGAKLTSQLWEQGLVNREEGERLVAFTTSSDPIFLIGAVSVGFFHDATLAIVLGAAHYGGAIAIGLLMRFHGRKSEKVQVTQVQSIQQATEAAYTHTQRASINSIWRRAFDAMHEARMKDSRTFGSLLSSAIRSSLNLIFVVGGLVVFFSVILQLLTSIGTMQMFYSIVNHLLDLLQLPQALAESFINGLFEVTLGAKSAGAAANTSIVYMLAAAAFVLSWGGLSVHAQVVSLLSHTNLRYSPFMWARLIHGILAAILVFILWEPLHALQLVSPVTEMMNGITNNPTGLQNILLYLPINAIIFGGTLALIAIIYVIYLVFRIVFRAVIDYDGTRKSI